MPRETTTTRQGEKKANQYIPKYIVSKPWYQDGSKPGEEDEEIDELSHQRKTGEIIDHSIAQSGSGIKEEFKGTIRTTGESEDYDAKRDRWYGYSTEEWLDHLKNWKQVQEPKQDAANDDSDDTDYELELIELGLDRKDLNKNIKEDPMEKMLRDRQDIPAYIYNITANPNNKIKIDYDPKSRLAKDMSKGFLNDKNQFVKKLTGTANELTDLQKVASDLDNEHEQERIQARLKQQFFGDDGEFKNQVPETDLNLSLEASPTLMMLKAKQLQKEKETAKVKEKSKTNKNEISQKYTSSGTTPNLDKNGLKKSRYPEDQLSGNHKFIYGSYYEGGKWGYKCCKQFDKDSRCTL
ncbi:Pre-mRNA-splicing factor SLU7 [Candida viswanathii]|uniref:Pre-mRNA-splicing factor SLU7 n=1 Tax=Candida viswanathii TaxID=5486 RepID=A0A367YFV7_9ASCO|nr:Pre-mRNA-splicing factor SLU7 [Candida viswanathii]